ncbi:protein-disulfide isomerase, partial [Pseudomonas aeruginosa]|nr:protein-disulfide isomerase [Pseudomonas aeruginosa]
MTLMNCDPATGSCRIPDAAPILPQGAKQAPGGEVTLRYIGDPMCSWCWGISSTLEELARYCEQKGIGFTLSMGGLRAGGGDAWGPEFREFLRREWTHIAKVTGQPFGFSLLSAKHFDYDTEPACRAVVVAEQMLDQKRPVASAT